MKKEALITSDQERQIRRIAEDGLNKALKALKLTTQAAQQIITRGNELQDGIIDKMCELGTLVRRCLKCISTDKKVVIGGTSGTEVLATANDMFNHIDPDFTRWGCDGVEPPTKEMAVEVYELTEHADYRKMFGGFGQNLDRLCFTTPQIKSFVANHADKFLREDGWAHFHFLFKVKAKNEGEKDEFFVAHVYRSSDGLREVSVYRLSGDYVWSAGHCSRVVVPQLESSES